MALSPIDIFFIVIILFFGIFAFFKGFIREIFGKIAWILGVIAGFLFCGKLKPYILPYVKFDLLATLASFILIFIVVFLVVHIIKTIIGRFFEDDIMRGLDKALGFFFGLIEGVAVVMLILFVLTIQPFFPLEDLLSESFFFVIFQPILSSASTVKIGTPA